MPVWSLAFIWTSLVVQPQGKHDEHVAGTVITAQVCCQDADLSDHRYRGVYRHRPADGRKAPLRHDERQYHHKLSRCHGTGYREQYHQQDRERTTIEGIGDIHTTDLRDPEFLIALEPISLKRYGLTVDEVAALVAQRNALISGGRLDQLKNSPELITAAELKSAEQLREMMIGFAPRLKLKDVAGDIRESFAKGEVYGSINGNKSIVFDLRTNESGDVLSTAESVRNLLAKEQELLGKNYTLGVGFDLSNEIQEKASIVQSNGLVGLGLVLVTLALFLRKRIALWVAISIPVCIFGTLAVLPAFGQILDVFTLSALILIIGIIVDDAVVVSDRIVALVEEGYELERAVTEGIKNVFPAVLASVLSTMIAFVPLLFLPGNSGKMMYVIPLTVIIALCFSFIDALLFIPAHLKGVFKQGEAVAKKGSSQLKWLNTIVASLIRKRAVFLPVMVATIIGLGVVSYQSLTYLFFPVDGAYLIEMEAEADTELSLDEVWKETQALEKIIKNTPEVAAWYGQVGTPVSTWGVSLIPANQRDRNAEQIVADWEKQAESITGLAQIEFDVDGGGPPAGRPVDLRVVGGSDEGREKLANDLVAFLQEIPGSHRVRRDLNAPSPQAQAVLQYDWLNYYGISAMQVGDIIKYAIDGQRVTRVFNGEEEVHFRVALDDNDRLPTELDELLVRGKNNQLIPLRKLVRWEFTDALAGIDHYNGKRVIRVSAGLDTTITDPVAVFDQVQTRFATANMSTDYQGASIIVTGQILETLEAERGFSVAIGFALFGILLLLLLLFDRVFETLIVLSVIPLGICGALFILFIHGQVLSFFAIIGMIALIGIMVNNSLVLVWHLMETEQACTRANMVEFVIKGTQSRVRPILLTTVTTVAGLTPLAYGLGGYDNYMSPMALVVGWGCVISMMVTLTVIPSLYLLVKQRQFGKA
nr:efflux RND transporter permease subunit [Endozoicomonas acroporae]